ncbi:hypothetical protein ABZ864_25335 [Streptomyces sp. NPDC047082]|uniref:hypothetical protein n=1 Tax=Streptomyces sp. NPDC047082 TaxID=3155259 RepID=UPI0033CA3188
MPGPVVHAQLGLGARVAVDPVHQPGVRGEATGRPARYEGSRLYLLTENRAP